MFNKKVSKQEEVDLDNFDDLDDTDSTFNTIDQGKGIDSQEEEAPEEVTDEQEEEVPEEATDGQDEEAPEEVTDTDSQEKFSTEEVEEAHEEYTDSQDEEVTDTDSQVEEAHEESTDTDSQEEDTDKIDEYPELSDEEEQQLHDFETGDEEHIEDEHEATIIKNDTPDDLILYIIIDKELPGLLSYFRYFGLNVSRVFTSIEAGRDNLITQMDPSRAIIIDTGTGRFTSMVTRRELLDLLGICSNDSRLTVFYTDKVIMSEVDDSLEIDKKKISWMHYRTTAEVVAYCLSLKKYENYIFDQSPDSEKLEHSSNILSFGCKDTGIKLDDKAVPSIINLDDIRSNMLDNATEDTLLPAYKIRV